MSKPRIEGMPKFFIFGDSHAGTIMRAARSLELDFAGGSIMAGMYLNDPFFDVRDGQFFMTDHLGVERLGKRLSDDGLGENLLDVNMPIISTVGFNTTNFAQNFSEAQLTILNSPGKQMISMACFRAVVEASRKGALDFYRMLVKDGKSVFAAPSPPRFTPRNFVICRAFEETMINLVSALGVKILDVRADTTNVNGLLLPALASPDDHVHGNDAFGEVVLRKFAEMAARKT